MKTFWNAKHVTIDFCRLLFHLFCLTVEPIIFETEFFPTYYKHDLGDGKCVMSSALTSHQRRLCLIFGAHVRHAPSS